MYPSLHSGGSTVVGIPAALLLAISPVFSASIIWDNSDATNLWSTPNNWDTNVEPSSADDLTFPTGLGSTITLSTGEQALSLSFDDDYTFTGGTLALASGNSVSVATGVTATINSPITPTGGLSKTGDGILVLGASNTGNGTGNTINAGTLRITHNNALGSSLAVTTVNSGTTLELGPGLSQSRPVTLMDGGTFAGMGTTTNNGTVTIDAAATAVTYATDAASDVFTAGTGSNDLTGGTAATTITIAGPGAVRFGANSNYDGSWNIPTGVLEAATATALGDQNTSSVTLSGGTLSARRNSAANYATGSPGNNLVMTTDSGLRSDRTSNGGGATHTMGTLSMGAHTLTMEPGPMVTSGTAGITLGDVTLSGDPVFAVNDLGPANGKLTTGSLLGGAVARTLTKTGAGDLAVNGGSTDLPAGSSFTATGGGAIEMRFAPLGAGASVAVTAAQNPFGEATIDITDGGLLLLADGNGTSTAQTYVVSNPLSLGGTLTLDADRISGSNTNKTFEFPSLSLAAGTDLAMEGDRSHGIAVSGPVTLGGNATLRGVPLTFREGQLTFDGGITGGGSDSLTIEGGTSPLNLTINSSSTYGGGTTINGSNVTLNAVNGLGTGNTSLHGGTLTTNLANALAGTVTITGGTLKANGADFLAANPIALNGGTLDVRDNDTNTVLTGGLTVNGNSGLIVGNAGSGSSKILDFPAVDVLGDTHLTITRFNNYTPNFQDLDLAGNLTLDSGGTVRVQEISEDASPRTLLKAGTGTLELEGANTYTGGTEVLRGTLLVQDAGALGTGTLTIGDSSGTNTAIARFDAGLTIPNDLVARSGGTGTITLDASVGNVTWNGNLDLQRTLNIDNGSSIQTAFLNGVLSGVGGLTKVSAGEIVLANAANSFGSGAADSISVNDGRLTAPSDAALGNPANGITLGGSDGILKIDGTFSSSRQLTFTGTLTGVAVTAGNEFTMTTPLAGTGALYKSDDGTLTLPPGLDSSARGAATTGVNGGILRVQSQKGLSDAGLVTFTSNSGGTLELLSDANTNFGHPVTQNNVGTIHVDRALGGSGSNGRHTLGDFNSTSGSGSLTITGDNGYGLTLGTYTTTRTKTLINNAPGDLELAAINGDPGTSARTLTLGGSGDIVVTGAITQGAGTGSYGIVKNGTGTLQFGTNITGFSRLTTVQEGTLDLNGLTYLSEDLTLGGVSSASGSHITTSGGTLAIDDGLHFNDSSEPAGASITGTLDLGSGIAHTFFVEDSSSDPLDLEIDGAIIGTGGSGIDKTGTGTLRFSGAGNNYDGLTAVSAGNLELNKSSGDGIGTGGLTINSTSFTNTAVNLLASEQINDAGSVLLSGSANSTLELNNFTETVGPLSLEQTDGGDYSGVRTGATGTLVLAGDLVLSNNTDNSGTDARNILITGTGTDATPATDGTLDLGGVNRTINVTTTTVGANEPDANATIETQIINGGIIKTGPRTLFLSHPSNTFAGGIQIFEGTVTPATLASLGTGGVSFNNTGAANAGIDLGGITGTMPDDFNISGSGAGTTTITYSAPKPNSLILSGAFTLERDLAFDVVNGSVNDGDTATLELTGLIDDGVDTANLFKMGNGTLKLAAGNTYSGSTTVTGGLLSIPADNALGDTTAALTLDGGALDATGTFSLARDLTFGAAGGSVRVDSPNTLTIPGTVTWGAGASAFYGSGATILSGTTSGSGSDLILGNPTDFADPSFDPSVGLGHVFSLRGTATLPTGHLSIVKNAVLELGTGDFTRALGTGPGEFEMDTNVGGGWAAHGANRIVNIGGAGATVTWGQQSPAFLYAPLAGSDYGDLILGSATATHTVDFQNPIELDNGTTFVSRTIIAQDGSAALDATISGDLTQSAAGVTTFLVVEGDGALEISGNIGGGIDFSNYNTGTLTLSGTNSFDDNLESYFGTLVITDDNAFGAPADIFFEDGCTIDASGMTSPLGVPSNGFFSVNANLLGSVATGSYFEGNGSISGDLQMLPGGYFYPNTGSQLSVGGDLTLDATSTIEFDLNGLTPDIDFNRVAVSGDVTIAGDLSIGGSGVSLGDSLVLINNNGPNPISGTFNGYPEGGGIPIGGGLAVTVSYVAGDGNDFGVTVVDDTFSTDLILSVTGTCTADFGDPIAYTYTIVSAGPGDVTDGILDIILPGNATFVSSVPAGTVNLGVLSVPLPALTGIDSTTVTLSLTAPLTEGIVFVDADVSSSTVELVTFNNSAPYQTVVFPGGVLVTEDFAIDTVGGTVDFSFDTVAGVEYLVECSTDLVNWSFADYVFGDGTPYDFSDSLDTVSDPKKFYRARILPPDGGGIEE